MRTSFVVLAITAALAALGCGGPNGGNTDGTFEAQSEVFDRQTKRSDRMFDTQEALNERYEKLLAKWEEQISREDAILEAEEKKAGIKPAKP